jgi:hypothetical protein
MLQVLKIIDHDESNTVGTFEDVSKVRGCSGGGCFTVACVYVTAPRGTCEMGSGWGSCGCGDSTRLDGGLPYQPLCRLRNSKSTTRHMEPFEVQSEISSRGTRWDDSTRSLRRKQPRRPMPKSTRVRKRQRPSRSGTGVRSGLVVQSEAR